MKLLLIISLFIFGCSGIHEIKPTGYFPIKEYGKWGYINSKGQTIIKCQFDWAGQFFEGIASIKKDSLYGFIDTTGKIIIEPEYYAVTHFSDSLCKVTILKDTTIQYAFIRPNGSIAFYTNYKDAEFFDYGRATVKINDEICFMDTTGKIVFNTHFPDGGGSRFHNGIVQVCGGKGDWVQEGLSRVWRGDSTKYFDTSGTLIASIEGMGNNDFSEGVALISINDKKYFIDKTGKIKIKPEKPELTYFSFSDGLAQVVIAGPGHKTGFIDTTGKIVIPITYRDVRDFKEGYAAFRENDGWGFIDKKGNVSIKPQFEEIDYDGFSNGLCKAKQNHQWGYLNYKGEFVWKEQKGLEYTKLDLTKWKLDTLEINKPFIGGKYAGLDNNPRKQTFTSLKELTLNVDTSDLTVFRDKYFAYKLFLINASKDTVIITTQDGDIKILQQALNKKNEWQDIENYYNSFCGNSYYDIRLAPNEFQIFATPIFKGEYKTQLRFKLELDKKEIYSNTFTGRINFKQFLNPKDKDKTGIAIWTH